MDLSTWQAEGKHFCYKGKFNIFFQESGQGETILLLHGFPTASWDWNKIWESLSADYQVIALDFIGFGFSDKPKNYSYSILDQADLVEALLQEKNIKKCHLLTHDYGDTVAQELLARSLDQRLAFQIQSLFLLNGGLFPETHHPRFIQKLLLSPIGILITPFLNRQKLSRNFHAIFGKETPPSETEITAFFQLIEYNNGKYVFHKLIRYMKERKQNRSRWVKSLQKASIPIQFFNGNADPISGKHMVERYRELIPNPDIVSLPEIGHYPQTEAPTATLTAYRRFLQKIEN
ncbi:MAG: alpha/beta hydrolase [Bacteroidota bacterium]